MFRPSIPVRPLLGLILTLIALVLLPGLACAQAPPQPQVNLVPVASGFTLPVHVTHAGDATGRLYVVEQAGRIRVVEGSAVLPTPFLDITDRVLSGGERGLLSVAFPPDYASKDYFYVNYTRRPDGDTIVARYRLLAGTRDQADPASEEVILHVEQPAANHNGGQLAFGNRDGYLYVGMGDGGGAPGNRAQDPATLLGKILRLDVETPSDQPYLVPEDNPFVGQQGYLPEIWALGLRNPWRFSFDRMTGDLYIGDVGQATWEEIDFQPATSSGGENYGWPIMEGPACYNTPDCMDVPGLTLPVAYYGRNEGGTVSGGMVYRGTRSPSLAGTYLFGDYVSGRLWGLRRVGEEWQRTLLLDTAFSISTFGEDEAGEVYLADYGGGTVYRLEAPGRLIYVPLIGLGQGQRAAAPRF
ncbi:MAG: PQQ-dependent sugar dehydrogenase [Anaerolineae bacterium]|jgi:glucose/arabinose dehydrogenase